MKPWKERQLALRAEALRLRVAGMSYSDIGIVLHRSRQRIQQVLSPPPEIKRIVAERANHQCEMCGVLLQRGAHYHHKNVEKDNAPENLAFLCASCHQHAEYGRTERPPQRVFSPLDPAFGPACETHPHIRLLCPACLGARGGQAKSARKAQAARENGKRGKRPRLTQKPKGERS